MDYLKVKGHDSLHRDPATGAIVNVNRSEFLKHVEARRKRQSMETVVDDINNLKDELSEIKALLRELINNASH